MKVRSDKPLSFTRDLAIIVSAAAITVPAYLLTGIHPLILLACVATLTILATILFTECIKWKSSRRQFSLRFALAVMTTIALILGTLAAVKS